MRSHPIFFSDGALDRLPCRHLQKFPKKKSSFNGAEALDDWLRSTLEMGCSGID
jgi:hypothetical protein